MLADSAGAGRYGSVAGAGPVTIPGRLPVLVRVGPGAAGAWLSGARRLSCSWGAASLRRFGTGGVRGRGVKDVRRPPFRVAGPPVRRFVRVRDETGGMGGADGGDDPARRTPAVARGASLLLALPEVMRQHNFHRFR